MLTLLAATIAIYKVTVPATMKDARHKERLATQVDNVVEELDKKESRHKPALVVLASTNN
jgi:hypothetical protein